MSSDTNGKRPAPPDGADAPQKKQKTGVGVICACCKEEKENSPEQFYKKQRQQIRISGIGVCRTCWDKLGSKGREQYIKPEDKERIRQKQEGKKQHKRQKQEEDAPDVDDQRAPGASPQHLLPDGARTPVTPTIRTESTSSLGSSSALSEQSIPSTPAAAIMDRKPSASPSDLSSNSRGRDRSMSPVTPFANHNFPPAPPSTPASDARAMHSSLLQMTPLPYQALQNADQLERQQNMLLQDGAATPAPTKPARPPPSRAKKSSNSLIDDFSDWAVGERYKLQRMLGRGSYGEVAQAIDLKQGRPDAFVAIKRIQSPFDQEIDSVRLFREIHLLRRLRDHECIIQLLDVVQPPTDDLADFHDLYLVFECECHEQRSLENKNSSSHQILLPPFCRRRHGLVQTHHVASIPYQ